MRTLRRRWLVAACILLAFFVYLRTGHQPASRDLPIVYTDHARERMAQRDISPEQVEHTVRRGRWEPGNRSGRFEAEAVVGGKRGRARLIRAVVAMEDGEIVVITTMVVR